jgi:hypothetical protein
MGLMFYICFLLKKGHFHLLSCFYALFSIEETMYGNISPIIMQFWDHFLIVFRLRHLDLHTLYHSFDTIWLFITDILDLPQTCHF